MKYTQTGSAARTTLITLVVIVSFLVVAIMLLPKGFSSDTSVIGQGSHVVVLAHDKDSIQSLTLMDLLNKVRSEYSSRIEFRVIDMNSPQGQAFLRQQQVRLGSLLLFAPDGTRLRVVSNIDDETELRAILNSILNSSQVRHSVNNKRKNGADSSFRVQQLPVRTGSLSNTPLSLLSHINSLHYQYVFHYARPCR